MKTFRLIIVLALFLGSFALDMSSAKNRAANSAYVSLNAELGKKEGYSTMNQQFAFPSGPEPSIYASPNFNYYLSVIGADGKEKIIGSETDTKSTSSFIGTGGACSPMSPVNVIISPNWFSKLPGWMQKYCSSNSCHFKTVTTLTYQQNAETLFQYTVNLAGGKTFRIILINGTDSTSNSNGNNQVDKNHINYQVVSHKQFNHTCLENLSTSIENIIDPLTKLLADLSLMREKASTLITVNKGRIKIAKDDLDKKNATKKKLVDAITILNSTIDKKNSDVKRKLCSKSKCKDELVSIRMSIVAESKLIEKEKKAIAAALEKAKNGKKKAIKNLLYQMNASYFYRVFAEKLVKGEAELITATTGNALKSTKSKIVKAFFPIAIEFSSLTAK